MKYIAFTVLAIYACLIIHALLTYNLEVIVAFYRRKLADAISLSSAKLTIFKETNQSFYETPKSFELWQDDPFIRIARWSRDRIFWITTN